MHDPFQSYQTLGAYSGGVSPFGLPYAATQIPGFYQGIPQIPGLNPFAAGLQNPLLQNPMLQNPMFQNPLLQNPLLQNPLLQQHPQAQTQWQNPLLTAGLQNPLYHGLPQQQFGLPQQQFGYPQQQFGYPQQQSGYPLAPQTQIGAGQFGGGQFGIGQGVPQINPLALQLAVRSLIASGISPWALC
jgi:hypothetical protein